MKDNCKYRFDVINDLGYQEQYTGLFENKAIAESWFNKHGKWLIDQGRKLIMVRCGSGVKVNNVEELENR